MLPETVKFRLVREGSVVHKCTVVVYLRHQLQWERVSGRFCHLLIAFFTSIVVCYVNHRLLCTK